MTTAPERSARYLAGQRARDEVVNPRGLFPAAASSFRQPLMDLAFEYCWGEIWNRPGLSRRERSILNMGVLLASNRLSEFKLHVQGALNNGCSMEEIQEVLLQCAVYCGIAAGSEGFRLAEEVLNSAASAQGAQK